MTARLSELLKAAGEQMPPARVPPDLWRRGRRQRRRERLATAGVLALLVLVVTAVLPGVWRAPQPPVGAGTTAAVPERVFLPWPWQATVRQAPAGPAALLFSGGGLGLRGLDGLDHEGKVAVVGRDGSYRMLLYGGAERVAGQDVQLSPDGRYVAQGHLAGTEAGGLIIIDLTTGEVRRLPLPPGTYCCAAPVVWAPDGASLLAVYPTVAEPTHFHPVTGIGVVPARLVLLDLRSGAATALVDLADRWDLRTASLAAFSPDGTRVAVTVGQEVLLLDTAGRTRWRATLGPRRHLVGPGAFTPDGTRIATAALSGCLDDCGAAELAARRWQVGYLDAATGADAAGPALPVVTGMAVRGLGWRHGQDLVAVRYQPERGAYRSTAHGWNDTGYWEVGHADLVALRPDGGTEVLLDPPGPVLALDIARDLLEAGRFGGASARPAVLPARWLLLVPTVPVAGFVLGAAATGWWAWRRQRPSRALRPRVPYGAGGSGGRREAARLRGEGEGVDRLRFDGEPDPPHR